MDELLRLSELLASTPRTAQEELRPTVLSLIDILDLLDAWLTPAAATEAEPDRAEPDRRLALIRRQLWSVLLAVGVRPCAAVGMPLDLRWHRATGQRSAPAYAPDTILAIEQNGYFWNDALLRTAQVVIAADADEACGEDSVPAGSRSSD